MGLPRRDHLRDRIERCSAQCDGQCAWHTCLQSGFRSNSSCGARPNHFGDLYPHRHDSLRNGVGRSVSECGEGPLDDHGGFKNKNLRSGVAGIEHEVRRVCERGERGGSDDAGNPECIGNCVQQCRNLQHYARRGRRRELYDLLLQWYIDHYPCSADDPARRSYNATGDGCSGIDRHLFRTCQWRRRIQSHSRADVGGYGDLRQPCGFLSDYGQRCHQCKLHDCLCARYINCHGQASADADLGGTCRDHLRHGVERNPTECHSGCAGHVRLQSGIGHDSSGWPEPAAFGDVHTHGHDELRNGADDGAHQCDESLPDHHGGFEKQSLRRRVASVDRELHWICEWRNGSGSGSPGQSEHNCHSVQQ